ncbi:MULTISPECIES: tagaturonate reductase [Olivibacter]|jgi:tagaturonate reductase|uniref:Tagaturonate reductase n=2 Tax=Olivibacter TaxID=376469 RepID=A0ABV6HI84_9SPHI|nr:MULTISPECIES: tagaturonate reductase [Olivibacter]MCL4638449.1 tagaturonate reductase [Olivibacter sp. UJ_SKK_5.1]MDX3913563.1 tagaturonate reductase [Pseudosphingobacterium sp.]QEL01477.1 tagaturonate reductase [Olivibacter sp. LS-1]
MERLNNKFLQKGTLPVEVEVPAANWKELPVKVIQFGTGVLLRGLPEYFIDKANRKQVFNGRIVVVKSTASGRTDSFEEQDGLYTLCVKGIENGKEIEEISINSSIKEVLTASENWGEILRYAEEPQLRVVISNTTEVGIMYDKDDKITLNPPHSYPAKLLAFLYKRFQYFGGDKEAGMVILPTELISDNGKKLKEIIVKLAEQHRLEAAFLHWLEDANYFCNTLVDRIVPGKLPFEEHQKMQERVGYQDDLMIMAEPFRLWAIEAKDPKVAEILSFSTVDDGMVITSDISKFKELKLRLLNGTHTFSCGLAVLAGCETVKAAMADPLLEGFIKKLLMEEIVPTVVSRGGIENEEAKLFAEKVLDRFRNQSLDHKWINITLNYTSKMEMRNVALIKGFYDAVGEAPEFMAMGFAAYILFMKAKRSIDNTYKGYTNEKGYYTINDEYAALFEGLWSKEPEQVVEAVLNDQRIWKQKLTLPGFQEKVLHYLRLLMDNKVKEVIKEAVNNKKYNQLN